MPRSGRSIKSWVHWPEDLALSSRRLRIDLRMEKAVARKPVGEASGARGNLHTVVLSPFFSIVRRAQEHRSATVNGLLFQSSGAHGVQTFMQNFDWVLGLDLDDGDCSV
jgi:hypothetical protein